ncbi:MAG: magnesium transporter [Longimicrobiales bacterium]|nr:magnesium transporter [Longimicrobiales bacterium]
MTTPPDPKENIQERIEALVEGGDFAQAGALVEDLHPSDVADIIESLGEEGRVSLVSILPPELASETLAEMEQGENRSVLLAALTPEKGAELIEELADDDAADLMGELEVAEQQKILEALPGETAEELIDLLRYDEETAGGRMTTDLVAVRGTLNAQQALEQVRLQGREVEDFYTVFVVDGRRRLLGTLRLDDLVIADPADAIAQFVEDPVATAAPELDQEEVGRLMARYNLAAIPVVSPDGILLGRITFDDVIDVIEAEQTEDILRLAGVTDEEELRHNWTESVKTRLPWLALNLLTAAAAASVILIYEDVIDQVLTLAFLAPIIAAMGGSSGTQSLAITIRRLAVEGSGSARGFVLKEILIGLVIGGVLGVGIAALAIIVDGNPMLGLVVMLAMWGNQIVAGFAGAFVPATLDRLGVDPSVASSVFVHTLTDLCGFFLLLGLASKLLLG